MQHLLHVLKVIAVILSAAGFFAKEKLDTFAGTGNARRAKRIRRSYLVLMIATFIGSFALEGFDWRRDIREDRLKHANELVERGRREFYTAIDRKAVPGIEQTFPILQKALDELRVFDMDDTYYARLTTYNDLSLGHERAAYGDSAAGCIYTITENHVNSCRIRESSSIFVSPPRLQESRIRCTDIQDSRDWEAARRYYDDLYGFLMAAATLNFVAAQSNVAGEVAAAARNTAYFYLCDHLRLRQDNLRKVERALLLAHQIAGDGDMRTRLADAEEKLLFLRALDASSLEQLNCTMPCQ